MVKTIIKGVVEEARELATATVNAVAKQPSETADQIFRGVIGMPDAKSLPEAVYAKKQQENLKKDQKDLAEKRKRLRELMTLPQRPEPSVFEKAKQEEIAKNKQQGELAKQKQMQALPVMTQRPQRGDIRATQRRKVAHIETGKMPGQ